MTSVERNAYRREPTSVRAAALYTSQHRCSRYAQDYVGDKSPRLCCHTSAFGCVGLLSYLRAARLLTVALKLDWRCIVVAPNRVAT